MNSMYSNRRTFSSRVGFCGGVDVRTESKVGLRVEVVETELEGVKVVPVGEEVPVETELEVEVVPVGAGVTGATVEASFPVEF